ncbi:MAG: hypothetical protein IJN63_01850 [Clostridia bacterium]|nr:hypothetical protein [Clostridia bacterium]
MIDLLELQKSFIDRHLHAGDTAVDFTMGNGYDTAFLADRVGAFGKVYAFDIQQKAVDSTKNRLTDLGLYDRCTLILDSHSNADKYVEGCFKAGMFNLGWLPGSGDKSITTRRETTLPAIRFAISRIASDGILLIAIYPGHPEGDAEGKEVCDYLSTLDRRVFCVTQVKILNSPTSPYFMIVEKKEERS